MMDFLSPALRTLLAEAFWETGAMVGLSAGIAVVLGLPLALLLLVTSYAGTWVTP